MRKIQKVMSGTYGSTDAVEYPLLMGWREGRGPTYFYNMASAPMKRLSELGPDECGIIERVDTPEELMALVQMGCCLGSEVEVRHVAPAGGPMAICTCGRTLSVRKEAASQLWVRVGRDETSASAAAADKA